MKIKISNRLKTIANLINGKTIVDVGCDGANLAIWLAQTKNAFVYACDLRQGPLKKAKINVKKFRVENNVKLIQSNGLQNISLNWPKVNQVCVAGLGGKLIEQIILNCDELKKFKIGLILQPQSFVVQLRTNLNLNGFRIEKELAIVERKKAYLIMQVKFVGKARKISLKEAVIGNLNLNGNAQVKAYFKIQKNKIIKILKNLNCCKNKENVLIKKHYYELIYGIINHRM